MELALGQFTSRGPATGFIHARGWQGKYISNHPALIIVFFSGVGIAMIINSILGTLYYNVIIAWALFYFVLSFRKRLLWADCGYWWNTDKCFVPGSQTNSFTVNGTSWNCTEEQYVNFSMYDCQEINVTGINITGKVTVTEEFY
jgi:hypothetical protein